MYDYSTVSSRTSRRRLFASYNIYTGMKSFNRKNILSSGIAQLCRCQNNLSLDMDYSPTRMSALPTPRLDISATVNLLVTADCSREFSLSLQSIDYLTQTLEAFAAQEKLDPAKAEVGNLISTWLMNGDPQKVEHQRNPNTIRLCSELDFIYKNFWTLFKPTVQRIIGERPLLGETSSGTLDLAFRCERYQELTNLFKLAESSSLLRIILDIFAKELFIHCARRKLVMIELNRLEPSTLVRQFVDIYLDLPGEYTRLLLLHGKRLSAEAEKSIMEMQINHGLQFNLRMSIEKHGPLERVASLVFDAGSALSFGLTTASEPQKVVEKFRLECAEYTSKLAPIWRDLDKFASGLSSPMSNLVEFSNRVKFAAPALIYGSVCTQLAQMTL